MNIWVVFNGNDEPVCAYLSIIEAYKHCSEINDHDSDKIPYVKSVYLNDYMKGE